MENKCLIIMPTSEPEGYASGHFGRVYDYILLPACRAAGFWPERADNPNNSPEDIIRNILESDIVICDLSSNNTSVLYAFAIRQSLNLPVVLVKDGRTNLSFYSKDFNEVEYDDSLRIDTVQKATQAIGDALKAAFDNKGERNTLLTRLGIDFTKKVVVPETTFVPEPLIEPVVHKEPALPVISPLPSYVGESFAEEEIEKLKVGGFLFHLNYGKGEIKTLKKVGKDNMAGIQFDSGQKILVLNASNLLRKIDE
jgi:hypothetical protein